MNLKYYLRGLGLGILVTAVILGVTGGNKESLTNEEIITRAKALGMTENTVLTDLEEETKPKETLPEEELKQEETLQQEEALQTELPKEPQPETDNINGNEAEPISDTGPEGIEVPETEETLEAATQQTSEEPVIFAIKSGDGSYGVCKRLETVGLIKSAADFDAYLVKNGYDKKLVVAEHVIPAGATEDVIAQILISRQ